MKIKDNTSKQNLLIQDCKIWCDDIIKNLIKNDCEKELVIDDYMVQKYNSLAKQSKSNASFVRRVKKILNDEFYCETFDVWINISDVKNYFKYLYVRTNGTECEMEDDER